MVASVNLRIYVNGEKVTTDRDMRYRTKNLRTKACKKVNEMVSSFESEVDSVEICWQGSGASIARDLNGHHDRASTSQVSEGAANASPRTGRKGCKMGYDLQR